MRRVLYRSFPPEVESVAEARHAVRDALRANGAEHFEDRTIAILNELVTNAILHGRTRCVVGVFGDDRRILVEVSDLSTDPPDPFRSLDLDEAGRGLVIVNELGDAWGWRPTSAGKSVWVWLDRDAGATPAERSPMDRMVQGPPGALFPATWRPEQQRSGPRPAPS